MRILNWRIGSVQALFLLGIVAVVGCGVESQQKLGDKSEKKRGEKQDGTPSAKSHSEPEPVKEKVVSKLPFKDIDPSAAKIGIEVGQKVMAAKGVDSSGKKFGLDDYKGKVILLDTWASW